MSEENFRRNHIASDANKASRLVGIATTGYEKVNESPTTSDVQAEEPNSTPPLGEWQFSLRSLMTLTTVWAVLLAISMSIPGLQALPFILGAIALVSILAFGTGCLVGWIVEKTSRNDRTR